MYKKYLSPFVTILAIPLIGLILYCLSSYLTFSEVKLPPDMQEFQSPYASGPSFLCAHSFGLPFNLTTWENHCLPEKQIIYQQIANFLIWTFVVFFMFIVINFKKYGK